MMQVPKSDNHMMQMWLLAITACIRIYRYNPTPKYSLIDMVVKINIEY